MNKKYMIERLVNHYTGGNKSKFASMLGVTPQTINTWMARNSFDIELLFAKCEYISAEWLLTGEGDMIKPETQPNASSNTVSMPSEFSEDGVIGTLKDIIREQAKEIARLEIEVETLKNGAKTVN